MEFQVQQKPVAKYGRNRNRVAGINFFDDHPKSSAIIAPALKKYPISPSSAGEQSSKENVSIPNPNVPSPSSSPSLVLEPARVTTHSRSLPSRPRSPSPVKISSILPAPTDTETFDILSSDDEPEMLSERPLKKRKLTQSLKQQKARSAKGEPESQKLPAETKVRKQVLTKKSENASENQAEPRRGTETHKKKDNGPARPQQIKSESVLAPGPTLALKSLKSDMKPRAKKLGDVPKSMPVQIATGAKDPRPAKAKEVKQSPPARPKPRTQLKQTLDRGKSSQIFAKPIESIEADDADMSEEDLLPAQKKRAYVKTKPAADETPKRRRKFSPARSEASAASPGAKLFSELRLSPSKSPLPDTTYEMSLSPIQSPARPGRSRRIDRLDAPAEAVSLPSTRAPSLQRSLSSAKILHQAVSDAKQEESELARPTLTRSNSSQTKLTYAKSRNTYGKERSYLADMVDDLEALNYDSSQEASQKFASQLTANSAPSQLQMELELDSSSSDDGVVPLKLKSIHELRQAGSNDRFSRDLEGLLLDIDPTAAGATKSLRIQACMKLFTKLPQEAFATFILDQGLDRLVQWSRQIEDRISQLLFNMVFWCLIHVKGASPVRVRSILQAVATSTSLITDFGVLTVLVKDRKENLSKIMVRDLIKFERDTIIKEMLPTYEGDDIVPAAIVLAALHDALQKLIQAGLSNVSMGSQSIKKIVHILSQVTQQTRNNTPQDRFITKTVLSLLKLFSGPLESDLGLEVNECVLLGNTLSDIINTSLAGGHEDLLQAVLHFAVSLCNDKPAVCRNINKSAFVATILSLSHDRFVNLVKSTDSGGTVDTVMLDSIILSLASLLNITEYDDKVRVDLANQKLKSSQSTNLMMLIDIYVKTAPQADTAVTAEKVQLQVAFGWLSLLICNLCLEDSIWEETQQHLRQSNLALSDVVASAKELLIHLQTVEMGQRQAVEDESTIALDGFTLRFGAILAAVKIA